MIGILLLILKIIGITLLILLGLIIFILLIILFMPIVYSIKGTMHTELDTLEIKGKVRWLFGLVRIEGWYKYPELDWHGFVAWYQLNDEKRKKSRKIKKNNVKTKKSKKGKIKNQTKRVNDEKVEENQSFESYSDTIALDKITKEKSQKTSTSKVSQERGKEEKNSWKHKCINKWKSIVRIKSKIVHTFHNICDTIQMIIQKKDKIIELYHVEEHQYTIVKCKVLLLYLWRKIRPKKFVISAKVGFEDPSLTGKMLGGLGVLLPFYGDTIHITPKFEEVVYDGNINIKGRFCIFPLVVVLVKLICDKKVRETYNNIKAFKL